MNKLYKKSNDIILYYCHNKLIRYMNSSEFFNSMIVSEYDNDINLSYFELNKSFDFSSRTAILLYFDSALSKLNNFFNKEYNCNLIFNQINIGPPRVWGADNYQYIYSIKIIDNNKYNLNCCVDDFENQNAFDFFSSSLEEFEQHNKFSNLNYISSYCMIAGLIKKFEYNKYSNYRDLVIQ